MAPKFLPEIEMLDNCNYLACLHELDDICCVYFICHEGAVKIGRTTDLKKRMETIQTSCHSPIELLYSFWTDKQTETELHTIFSDLRLKGEWFRFNKEFVLRLNNYMKLYNTWWNETKKWIDSNPPIGQDSPSLDLSQLVF